MEKIKFAGVVIVLAVMPFFLVGCWDDSDIGPGGDADSDSDSDTDNDADADSDVDTDTDTDSDADADSDTDTDTGSETNRQGPIKFVLSNPWNHKIYVSWSWNMDDWIRCENQLPETAESCSFELPYCGLDCANITPDDCGCIDCDHYPAVKVIPAGGDLVHEWDGLLREADFEYCADGCECYRPARPKPGNYRASAYVWNQIECWDDNHCEPDAEGVILEAEPVGVPVPFEAVFEVVFEGDTIFLTTSTPDPGNE